MTPQSELNFKNLETKLEIIKSIDYRQFTNNKPALLKQIYNYNKYEYEFIIKNWDEKSNERADFFANLSGEMEIRRESSEKEEAEEEKDKIIEKDFFLNNENAIYYSKLHNRFFINYYLTEFNEKNNYQETFTSTFSGFEDTKEYIEELALGLFLDIKEKGYNNGLVSEKELEKILTHRFFPNLI